MSQRVVFLNGSFVPEREAKISIYDMSLSEGAMAFEVCRTFNGRLFKLREHLERLHDSLSALGVQSGMSLGELERVSQETLARNLSTESADTDWNLIVNVSPGPSPTFIEAFTAEEVRPTVIVSCFPMTRRLAKLAGAYHHGVDVVVPEQRAMPPDLLDPAIKTRGRLHYLIAAQQAGRMRAGATAVLVNPQGYLTESTNANVFLVREGKLYTPHLRDVLPGVTRGVILDLAEVLGLDVAEADLTVKDALQASEVLLTSTSIGILHARSFNGTTLGDGKPGPIGLKLRTAFDQHVGVDIVAQATSCAQRLTEEKAGRSS